MFKIDSEGATVDNQFTEGNPGLGVAATIVSSDWLNAVQGEVVKVIEEMGIALAKADSTQLYTSLIEMFLRGGRKLPISQAIANNTGPADVTGFEFDSALIRSKIALYSIERKSDDSNVQESGLIFITRDTADGIWRIETINLLDDSGMVFSDAVVAGTVSKLQYTSNDLAGANYSGNISLTSLIEIRI